MIFQTLYACVKESLGRNSFGASIDFDKENVPEMPVFGSSFKKFRPEIMQPNVDFDPSFNPFELSNLEKDSSDKPTYHESDYHRSTYSNAVDKRDDYGKLFDENTLPSSSVIVLQGKYILTYVKSGVLIINIKRAKERILFEIFLDAINANGHVSQTALFPVRVTVGVDNRLVFDEYTDLLSKLGFDIVPFGNDTIVVNGVPEGFSLDESSVEELVSDILVVLNENHSCVASIMETSIAEKFAKIGSATGKSLTSTIEAQRLIDTLFGCTNSEFTSSGNRIMSILSIDEIDKKF